MKKKAERKKFLSHVLELLVVVGFVCFGAGYMLTGGAAQVKQFAYGENMTVNVSIPDLGINQQVQLYKGMTPFDAILRVASVKTEYYASMGSSMVTEIGGTAQFWGYKVNGETQSAAMQDYQLRDGDNLLLFKLEW
jgi:hypothetical protein